MATHASIASGTFTIGGDLTVNRMGFGAMRLTGPGIWEEPKDRAEAKRVLRRAVELGINFIDTADSYGPDVSELLISETLYPYPEGLVIATKGGMTRSGPNQWSSLGRPEYLRQCVEMSLRRLKLHRIDLYQLHRIDPKVPAEDQVGELKKMQEEGKIRHIGLSDVTPAQIDNARKTINVVSVQHMYNIGKRGNEDTLQYCEANELAFIPWYPMAAGKLAQPGGVLEQTADKHHASLAQLAIAWLLHRSKNILAIPGTSSVRHLEENFAAAALRLDNAEWTALEQKVSEANQG